MRQSLVLIATAAVAFALFMPRLAHAIDITACKSALVQDTFSSSRSRLVDWRMAEFVSEDEYNSQKRSVGGQALIFGVPAGANYSEFQSNVRRKKHTKQASLTLEEFNNVAWTGLRDAGVSAYRSCLTALRSQLGGLVLTVEDATDSDVTLRVTFTFRPPGMPPARIALTWDGATPAGAARLPAFLENNGSNTVRVQRPAATTSVTVNIDGSAGDHVVLTPLPLPVSDREGQACGGVENARSKFTYSGSLLGGSFLLRVPPCGLFTLAAKVSDYRFGRNGPEGPENPPTDHLVTVDHSLCIENGSDGVGPYMRLHVNRDCGTYDNPRAQVFFVRPNRRLADVSSNWEDLVRQIQERNASFN